ncbi:hypothetical protein MTR67_001505 [Solanum verrucosum]|uniref:ABC transporter domain-containing protein n=1 Tax=Solanum verrucosum TaxID=315347 RepID=A0AAF0PQQ2_SOLVR|nr:hypothetical protein MTR67_001505 [Solanum verrucosum]
MASAIMDPSGSGKTTLLNVLADHSRGSVYAKFDDVVLLAGGSLIYAGLANDEVLAYFSKFGHCIPGTVAYLCCLLV